MPVFRHADAYIGLVALHQQPKSGIRSAFVLPVLAGSPDCRTWHWITEGTPFIPPAEAPSQQLASPLERRLEDRSYDYGCIFTCANPICHEDEIRIYYVASDFLLFGWREGSLALFYLRPDGFAGYRVLDIFRGRLWCIQRVG